ncbi:Lsr2 family protein [Sphaerisporangium melleum]|uniref:Lsr2 family protein n=1 Tax=Sphaerisporangium melleum TaxID=321316 RepID=A0A917R3U6_9ACTN|nr:Lsr2 family protein [Sphaerisporangium melleum]GGK87398.1 Lsr2 family protein [Sphaerisporangium melleum]GII72398.1 Lsr2 family protein [Sphaerisporangium melleum]
MATQIQTLLIDDLEGGEAKETVSFAIDGTQYEIDLNDKNARNLREALSPFVSSARRADTAPARGGRKRGGTQRSARDKSSEIRAWAKAHGLNVSERGRIASHIVAQYEAAQ